VINIESSEGFGVPSTIYLFLREIFEAMSDIKVAQASSLSAQSWQNIFQVDSIAKITHDESKWLFKQVKTWLVRVVEVFHFVLVLHCSELHCSFAFLFSVLLVKLHLGLLKLLFLSGLALLNGLEHVFLRFLWCRLDNSVRCARLLTLEKH